MITISGYLITIIIATIISGICTSLVPGASGRSNLIRAICGIFVAFTVVKPLTNIRINDFSSYWYAVEYEAEAAALLGEESAHAEASAIIKEQLESYIIQKANELGAEIAVQIKLTDQYPPTPVSAKIDGTISPYNKKILCTYISEQINIPEEQQIWN